MFYAIIEDNVLINARVKDSSTLVKDIDFWGEFELISDERIEEGSFWASCPSCGEELHCWSLKGIKDKKGKLSHKKFSDLIRMWDTDDLILSERFVDIIKKNELTGIQYYEEIPIVGRNKPDFKYYNTRIAISDMNWSFPKWTRHKVRKIRDCEKCGKRIEKANGLVLKDDSISYDIFQLCSMPGTYWVSERMAKLILEAKLTNIILVPENKVTIKGEKCSLSCVKHLI